MGKIMLIFLTPKVRGMINGCSIWGIDDPDDRCGYVPCEFTPKKIHSILRFRITILTMMDTEKNPQRRYPGLQKKHKIENQS